MDKGNIARLRVNPSFNILVAPYPEQVRVATEKEIIARGQSTPIRVWGNTVLVDQEVYLYCRTHSIPMKLVSIPISNQEEAVLWICKNQLLRSDLTEEMRKYLIGKRCHAEKVLGTLEVAANRKAAREHESDEEYVPTHRLRNFDRNPYGARLAEWVQH
jgi:hypothetical protein